MESTHRYISRALLAAIVAMVAALAFTYQPTTAEAHHGRPGESPQLAQARDAIHLRKCDAFRYDGRSPSLTYCKALLSAAHRVTVRKHGRTLHAARGWISSTSTLKLLRKESGYDLHAVNPSSGACGMGQMLPCDKFGPGSCWPRLQKQADCFIRYVLGRYYTPTVAWQFWLAHHWY